MKTPPGKALISNQDGTVGRSWLEWFADIKRILSDGLAASRLVAADADGNLADVDDLTDWIAGTSGDIVVDDDGDGSVTLRLSSKDFGSLKGMGVADNLNTVAVDTWYQVVSFTAEGSSVNMDPNVAESHIEVAHGGFYIMGYSFTGYCAAAHDWRACICKNNNATRSDQTSAFFSTTVANKRYTVTGSDILYLNEDDTVELWLMRLSAGANIVITVDYVNLWLQLMLGM